MRFPLIAAELAAAAGLLAAVLMVAPGESARVYALATIMASVLPGLMLTGDVKMLNAGVPLASSGLLAKAATATALNLPVVAIGLGSLAGPHQWAMIAGFVTLSVLGASAQAFSSVWYYVQADKGRMLGSKAAALAARLGFAAAAVVAGELMLALVGVSVGALVEFGLNFRALPWRSGAHPRGTREMVSPLGAAYGVSRLVSATVKVGLTQLLGPLIASFLVIEQLVGGVNSLFEKYFVRSARWQSGLRIVKLLYLTAILACLPSMLGRSWLPQDRSALVWLALVACAGLLPLAEMYAALRRRSQSFVAYGSAAVSLFVALGIGAAWMTGWLAGASLAAYVLLPGLTFVFYWLSSLHVRHNPEQQAPR